MSYIPKTIASKRMSVPHVREQFAWLLSHDADKESFYQLSGVVEFERKRSMHLTRREFDRGWKKHKVLNQNPDNAASEFIKVITGA